MVQEGLATSGKGSDLARMLLAAIFLCGLIVATLWILRPFLAAVV